MTDPMNPDRPVEDAFAGDAPLGAAPTLSGRLGKPAKPARERRGARPSIGLGRGAAALVIGAILLALVPLVASGLKKTPKDRAGISYGGGPIEGSHFQKIVQPGSALFFNGFLDPLYLYPADQQNYIVSMSKTEGAKPKPDAIVAPSSDRVQVTYQLAVYYKLNTDRLRAFHEQFGLQYRAYTSKGWDALIEDTFRQQIENALQEETRRNTVADIFGDADLLLKIQRSAQATLSTRLELAMGQKFFCAPTWRPGGECKDPTFIIKKVSLPDSVITAFENNRTSEIEIQTKTNQIAQREAEAKGIAALNEALGESGQVYALLKAIESGKINFWVVPSDNGLTLATPGTGATATPGG